MPPISLHFLKVLLFTTLCHYSAGAQADACVDFSNHSVQQQDNNLFNLCGFRGSQWTSSRKDLIKECRVMSVRDRAKRLSMRDKLLTSCPTVADSSPEFTSFGRNRQQKLLTVLLRAIRLKDENLVRSVLRAGVNVGEQPVWMAVSPLF